MKPVIECGHCEICAMGYETGFTGNEVMRCTRTGNDVTRDDGCTMGQEGIPGKLGCGWDVSISGHETVWGWH